MMTFDLNKLKNKDNLEILDILNTLEVKDDDELKPFDSVYGELKGDADGILKDKTLLKLMDILEIEELYNNKGNLFLVQSHKYYATKTITKFGKLYYDLSTLNEVPFYTLNLNLYSEMTFGKLNPIQAKYLADYAASRGLQYKHGFLKD